MDRDQEAADADRNVLTGGNGSGLLHTPGGSLLCTALLLVAAFALVSLGKSCSEGKGSEQRNHHSLGHRDP